MEAIWMGPHVPLGMTVAEVRLDLVARLMRYPDSMFGSLAGNDLGNAHVKT